jgi:PTS system nitrogen regulatory IIA component
MSNSLNMSSRQLLTLCQASLLSKKRLFERASEAIAQHFDLPSGAIYRELLSREKLGSTAIGEGVAIPHCRVDFLAIDDYPVDIIFILLVPKEATQAHLDLLSNLATIFSDSAMRSALRAASTAQSLQQLLIRGSAT